MLRITNSGNRRPGLPLGVAVVAFVLAMQILQPTFASAQRPTIGIGAATVLEGDTGTVDAVFTVTRSKPTSSRVEVEYTTVDGSATAGSDYEATSGTLIFERGETAKTIRVRVMGDLFYEPHETFSVVLLQTTRGTLQPSVGVATITNDDAQRFALIHYIRFAGDYGDHTTGNNAEFWGLDIRGDGVHPSDVTDWTTPKPFLGEDEYGRFAYIQLLDDSLPVTFVIHRGDTTDPDNTAERTFNPDAAPEIWLRQGDANVYTSQVVAQGFATIHYPCTDCTEVTMNATSEGSPVSVSPPSLDDYGVVFTVSPPSFASPLTVSIYVSGITGIEAATFTPTDTPSAWFRAGQPVVYDSRGAAEGFAIIHYRRPGSDYGDPTSADFNDFWGLHVSAGAAAPTTWTNPLRPVAQDVFGLKFRIDLVSDADHLIYVLHRGDTADPGPDQSLDFAIFGHEVWQLQGADPQNPYVAPQIR